MAARGHRTLEVRLHESGSNVAPLEFQLSCSEGMLDALKSLLVDAVRGTPTTKRWLPIDEAADYLSITPGAVRKRIERGSIPSTRSGGRRYVDREKLDRTLAGRHA